MGHGMTPTLMLVGLGDLGAITLELLARETWLSRIVVASRDAERGVARCNLARLGALAQGCSRPTIEFIPLDLHNIDATAATIQHVAPDLIYSTATLQTWWLPDLLPKPHADLIHRAGFGMWLPVHLTLTMKLMQAVHAANYSGLTLTAPFPDVVNHVLSRIDLAPTCGVGNLDEIVPKVRLLAAAALQAPIEAVWVWLVGHHALMNAAYGDGERSPYFLRVEYGGQDVTDAIDAHRLLFEALPVTSGTPTHFLTAGSTVRLIRALLCDEGALLHAPAPNGLPGGYPIIASASGVKVAPLDGLTLDEAISINQRSHPFDGIERVEVDGSVTFNPESVAIFRKTLGYDCERLAPAEAEHHARELMACFREFAARYGVTFDKR